MSERIGHTDQRNYVRPQSAVVQLNQQVSTQDQVPPRAELPSDGSISNVVGVCRNRNLWNIRVVDTQYVGVCRLHNPRAIENMLSQDVPRNTQPLANPD